MKRNLILTLIACGASFALCPALQAQDASPAPSTTGTDAAAGEQHGGHRGGGGGGMLARLTTELSLTPDQVTQIKPIVDAAQTQFQTIRGDTTLAQADRMAKFKDARDAEMTQIKALLTPDQQAKLDAFQEKMHNRRHGGEGGASPSPAASAAATP
jgi:Spy/CpxP family protein refolding chaperone